MSPRASAVGAVDRLKCRCQPSRPASNRPTPEWGRTIEIVVTLTPCIPRPTAAQAQDVDLGCHIV